MTERAQQDRDEFAKSKRDTWNTTDYGSWFKFARGEVIDTLEKAALKKALAGRNYERALDVGIGNGRLLPIYSPHAKHITGMDISSEQLDQAARAARDLGINFDTKLCHESGGTAADGIQISNRPSPKPNRPPAGYASGRLGAIRTLGACA